MKELRGGRNVEMSSECIARIRAILDKNRNVVFVDFSKGRV